MPKYDAFGREIGENTFSGLGGSPSIETRPSPAREAEPTPTQTLTPKPAKRRRRRSGAPFVFLIVMIGIGVQAFVGAGDGDEEAVRSTPPAPTVEGVTPNVEGETPASLVGAARFGSAMSSLQASGLGRLTQLRVARDRIDAQLLTRNGKLRIVQVTPDLEVRTLATTNAPSRDSFGFGVVRERAPQRLVREASRKLGRARSEVDYLVFSRFGGDLQWAAYFRDGRHAVGDVDGRLKRVF